MYLVHNGSAIPFIQSLDHHMRLSGKVVSACVELIHYNSRECLLKSASCWAHGFSPRASVPSTLPNRPFANRRCFTWNFHVDQFDESSLSIDQLSISAILLSATIELSSQEKGNNFFVDYTLLTVLLIHNDYY